MGKKKAAVALDWLVKADHDPTADLIAQQDQIARSSPNISDPQARRSLKGLHQPVKEPPTSEVGFLSPPVESPFDETLAQQPEIVVQVPPLEPAPFVPSATNERTRTQKRRVVRDIPTKYDALVRRAAREVGPGHVEEFCESLQRAGVPTPAKWQERNWQRAYANPALGSAIRSIKRRYSQTA
jgi:hypothetical protein